MCGFNPGGFFSCSHDSPRQVWQVGRAGSSSHSDTRTDGILPSSLCGFPRYPWRVMLVGGFYGPGTHFPLGRTQSFVLIQLQGRLGNGSTCVQEQKLEVKTHGLWQELEVSASEMHVKWYQWWDSGQSHELLQLQVCCQVHLPSPVSQVPFPASLYSQILPGCSFNMISPLLLDNRPIFWENDYISHKNRHFGNYPGCSPLPHIQSKLHLLSFLPLT